MHQKLLVSKYTAIKQLLHSILLIASGIYTHSSQVIFTKKQKIPLYKGRDNKKIIYISGIALQLSKSQNQEAMTIALAIAQQLLAAGGDVFHLQIVPPGWIHLELTHPVLAAWLDRLAVGGGGKITIKNRPAKIYNSSSFFAVQYAHARCCSLVRLADREGLIQLKKPLGQPAEKSELDLPLQKISVSLWRLIAPDPIPWLNSEDKLRLNHPAETHLISSLVQVVDDLECHSIDDGINWEKVALNLSQAFENFWCQCRIWGEVKITCPQLAQGRLGLVMATQSVFRMLLEDKLGVIAPLEL